MVHSYPQRDILSSGSAASDWCTHPETLQAFWPFAGNTPGIAAAIAARGSVDLQRRKHTADCIRDQYAKAGISAPQALTVFAEGPKWSPLGINYRPAEVRHFSITKSCRPCAGRLNFGPQARRQ